MINSYHTGKVKNDKHPKLMQMLILDIKLKKYV
jgi:hypothetical protein